MARAPLAALVAAALVAAAGAQRPLVQGRWARLASYAAAPARSGHVAGSNGTVLLLAGGAGAAGPEPSTTVVAEASVLSGGGFLSSSGTFVVRHRRETKK